MALHMQKVSTNAPFFKPPSSSQGSNYFALSSLSLVQSAPHNTSSEQSRQTQQHQRQQQSSQSNSTSTYFKTNNVQAQDTRKQKEVSSCMEQQSSDRLSALHTRLQLEAEKIRKWKNVTNVEIKEKDKKLEEALVTIEGQRKSLTGLQLKKEGLSSRLRDEVSNQKEIQRKISSTRDMCTALKDHAVQLDDAISKGEKDREVLSQLHHDKMEQFQELFARFQQLELGQREWMNSQTKILNEEKDRSAQLEHHCQALEQQLNESIAEVLLLNDQSSSQKESIAKLGEQLTEKSSQCDGLEKEIAALQQSLRLRDCDLNRLEDDVDGLQQQLTGTHSLLKEKEGQITEVKESLEQTKVSHAQQLTVLQSSINTHQAHCKELEGVNSHLKLTLKQTTDQLNENIGDLSRQLDSTTQQLTKAEEDRASLKESLSKEKEQVSQTEADKQHLKDQLAEGQCELKHFKEKMTTELQLKDDEMHNMKSELDNATALHQSGLSEWRETKSKLETQLSELERKKLDLIEKADTVSHELDKSRSQIKEMEATNVENKEKEDRVIAELTSEKQVAMEEISTLKTQVEALNAQQSELMEQCVEMKELKKTNFDLKESLESRDTQIERLNKALTDMQTELGSKNGELSGLINKYKKEAETSQQECLEVKKALETQVSELQSKLESTSGELNVLVEKYKKEAENAQQEHEETKRSFNTQVNDLCTVLEKYRAENQNMMSQKDREIESLREQLQESEVAKVSSETELSSYRDKVDLLQGDLSAKSQEMKELLEAVDCLQNKAKVAATPSRSSKPASTSAFVTPVHSTRLTDIIGTDDAVVSSTPKPRTTTLKKLTSSVMATPRIISKPLSDSHTAPLRSTPHRLYNYRVSSTPHIKNSRPPPSTPRSSVGNKPKKMCYQRDIDIEETEEMSKFKELYPDSLLDEDETVFKKPKPKGVAVRKASSTTSASSNTKYSVKQPLAHRNGRSRKITGSNKKAAKKKSEDLSWFDSDSVFGFGIED